MYNTSEYKNINDKYTVLLNSYNININNVVNIVFKHELKFQAYLPSFKLKTGKEIPEKFKDLWRGPKNEYFIILNYMLLINILKILVFRIGYVNVSIIFFLKK